MLLHRPIQVCKRPMTEPSRFAFRLATLLFATLLCMQCVWLLAAEISRPGLVRLPTNAQAATAAAQRRNAAAWAALIGAFRGDLWAESAFSDADLLIDGNAGVENAYVTQKLARARANLEHALNNAPAQPAAWLFRAGTRPKLSTPGLRWPRSTENVLLYWTERTGFDTGSLTNRYPYERVQRR